MSPSGAAIVVFAKAPRPGAVKTRMTPPLTSEQAAGFYSALLRDVLTTTAAFADELGLEAVLAVHPPEACPMLARDAPTGFRVVAQRGADLARRMTWAVREVAATGASRILLRGSDSPVLDGERVGEALSALEQVDLAICPDRNGGYSLIGLRRPVRGLFDHPMGTSSALQDTLANASALGLCTRTLAPTFDLDTVEDLRWLSGVRRSTVTQACSRTLAYLDEHDLWRFANTR